jgi:hypothetical protein
MQMAAEDAFELAPEPGSLAVSETYTAIVEGKGAKKVDNNFFLVNVPIGNCETQTFVNKFPRVSACVFDAFLNHEIKTRTLTPPFQL